MRLRLHQPGVLGIVVLAAATPLSIGLAAAYARDRVDFHAISLGSIGFVFWMWALAKVFRTGDHDYGAITFALVVLSSLASLCSHPDGDTVRQGKLGRASRAMWRLGGSSLLVWSNYVLVLLQLGGGSESAQPLRLYLLLGACWWGGAALWTCSALLSFVKSLKNSGGIDLEAEALVTASENEDGAIPGRLRVFLGQ